MPLFMDVHNLGGVSMDDVAKAHQPDLATQGEYDVSYLRYWMDEGKGQIFCMVEAPDAAAEVHRKADGLVADAVYRVQVILPGSARVAAVKSSTMRGKSLAYSGRIRCLTTMRIMLSRDCQLIRIPDRRRQHGAQLADLLLVVSAGLTGGQIGLAVPHAVADALAVLAVD